MYAVTRSRTWSTMFLVVGAGLIAINAPLAVGQVVTKTVKTADGTELPANWPEVVAGEHPFGHAKFRPSPDRPLGYRGCQNGWFPGATPPLHFGDGTAAQKEITFRQRGRKRTSKLWTLTDDKARNIRFKTPMPGWSLSQPLPVLGEDGKLRIIVKCHPWIVACVDGQTGKILWTDHLTPFHCMDLPKVEADKAAELMTMSWAVGDMVPSLLGHRSGGLAKRGKTILKEDDPKLYAQIDAALKAMADRLKTLEPTLVDDVTKLATFIAKGLPEKVTDQIVRDVNGKFQFLHRHIHKKYGITPGVAFHGYSGLEMPAPVSDGTHVWVTFGQGQVACYTLDGKRKWAKLYQERGHKLSMYYASPTLVGGKLIFYQAPEQKSGLVALDAATGEVAWRTEGGTPWAKVCFTSIRPARLPLPGGDDLEVVFARFKGKFRVFRVEDGKDLGDICKDGAYSAGPNFIGDIFVTSFSTDGRDQPDPVVRIRATSKDAVACEQLHDLSKLRVGRKRGLRDRPIAFTPAGVFDGWYGSFIDPVKGKFVSNLALPYKDQTKGLTINIAGKYAILPLKCTGVNFPGRGREDNWALMRFAVIDVSDPSKPKVISRNNLLGGPDMPRDLSFEEHLADFDLPKQHLLGAYRTILAHFGAVNCGVIPHGDMLFIQSTTHLYGIGK